MLSAVAAPAVGAQEPTPTPPDTLPRDTVRPDTLPKEPVRVGIPPDAVARDTLPGDTLMPAPADSVTPAPNIPEVPDVVPAGWAFGRWTWSRDELLRYRGMSLVDLLERLPGVHSIRAGGFGRPAGLSPAGLGGAAVRVYVDGYEIDPLGSPSDELQRIGLIDLEALTVERTPAGLRVELSTFRLPDSRAYSEVEAAAGNYGTRVLRATIARVAGARSIVTGAYDLTSTGGVGLAEPFQGRSASLRWSYRLTPTTGLQLDFRQGGADRGGVPYPREFDRRDVSLRARSRLLGGVTVEALVGRSWWNAENGDPPASPATPDTVLPDVARDQGSLRAAWTTDVLDVEGSVRLRSGSGAFAPDAELGIRGTVRPVPWITAEAAASSASLGGTPATVLRAVGRIGPFAGLSAFAGITAGDRWVGTTRDTAIGYVAPAIDTIDGIPTPVFEARTRVEPVHSRLITSAGGLRLGAEWNLFGATIGGALLTLEPGAVTPFELGFDRAIEPIPVQRARGVEAFGSLPIPWTGQALRLEGSASSWSETGGRPYLPSREARVALQYHDVRIDGQFEPTLRVEAVHRGPTLVPTPDATAFGHVMPEYTMLNLFLQIRILDVRAFLIWENPTHNRLALDLPDGLGFQPGQRVVYGARWWFRN